MCISEPLRHGLKERDWRHNLDKSRGGNWVILASCVSDDCSLLRCMNFRTSVLAVRS